ncbi:MAG: glycine--tRNA ligase [Patescibacteria group bacterium]
MAKKENKNELMDKIVSLCKRRGFIFPGSEIYGGMANSWDYGPLGVELKNNIKQAWWKKFVHERTDMVGIDAALVMNPKVWEASGHLKNFTDPLVECKKCHERFRADKIGSDKCPACGGELTSAKQFNLMFKTFIGPAEESANVAYFRPETAQAMFVDFKQVAETSRKRIPFGIAQVGKAFRNEITPGNFIFRTREFEQMEIEYFIREKDWEKSFEYWHKEMYQWMAELGLEKKHLHDLEVPDGERAHYSKRTIDIEYDFPFGTDELYGLAYRTDFDLGNHARASGQSLEYLDPETQEKFIPHVIEPTFGVDRSVLAVLCESYNEEEAPTAEKGETETRVVLKFPKWLAPIKVAILPLSKKEELAKVAKPLYEDLVKNFVCEYDETQSIGKRYRRQDEIGTPYCITVDFETLEDKAVTVRDRDTMKQERIKIEELINYLRIKLGE